MDLQPTTCERIVVRLEEECRRGRLKNRTQSILVFAELTNAQMTQEEFRSVRKHLSRVLRHCRAIRRALRQGDGQIGKIGTVLTSKPVTTLSDLGNQIGEAWLAHQETAFLEAAKQELEAETLLLKGEFEALKESISRYYDLMDAWNEFARWAVPCSEMPDCWVKG